MKNIFPLLKENHQELHAMGNLAKSMISQAVRKHEQDDGPNFAPGIVMLDKMWLGIDFNPNHIENYDKILANMLAVDNLSCHKADISSVYMKVIKCGKHVGTLMEDFSHNGTFEIFPTGTVTAASVKIPS